MDGNHPPRQWRLRMFKVVDESMRPALHPGDGVLAWRGGGTPRRGQLRVFPHPQKSTLWLVKRVGEVQESTYGAVFEALSDDPRAARAGDSKDFGLVPAAGSYRVVWTARAPRR